MLVAVDAVVSVNVDPVADTESVAVELASVALLDESVALVADVESVAVVLSLVDAAFVKLGDVSAMTMLG